MSYKKFFKIIFLATSMGFISFTFVYAEATHLDFTNCVIVSPENLSKVEKKALQVLREEIQKRTDIKLQLSHHWPSNRQPVIAVGLQSQLDQFAGLYQEEIYHSGLARSGTDFS